MTRKKNNEPKIGFVSKNNKYQFLTFLRKIRYEDIYYETKGDYWNAGIGISYSF